MRACAEAISCLSSYYELGSSTFHHLRSAEATTACQSTHRLLASLINYLSTCYRIRTTLSFVNADSSKQNWWVLAAVAHGVATQLGGSIYRVAQKLRTLGFSFSLNRAFLKLLNTSGFRRLHFEVFSAIQV